MTIPPDDRPIPLDRDLANDLLHLLGLLDEVLRHGNHDLRTDIADRYTPTTWQQLLAALDLHSSQLHQALSTMKGHIP